MHIQPHISSYHSLVQTIVVDGVGKLRFGVLQFYSGLSTWIAGVVNESGEMLPSNCLKQTMSAATDSFQGPVKSERQIRNNFVQIIGLYLPQFVLKHESFSLQAQGTTQKYEMHYSNIFLVDNNKDCGTLPLNFQVYSFPHPKMSAVYKKTDQGLHIVYFLIYPIFGAFHTLEGHDSIGPNCCLRGSSLSRT